MLLAVMDLWDYSQYLFSVQFSKLPPTMGIDDFHQNVMLYDIFTCLCVLKRDYFI